MENQISTPRYFLLKTEDKFDIGETHAKANEGWVAQLEMNNLDLKRQRK